MLSDKSRTPRAFVDDMKATDFRMTRVHPSDDPGARGPQGMFSAFDDFVDRMPAWIFHSLGAVTALVAVWFALAFLGGLPRDLVEWIALGMAGTFAYAVGFMIPLVLTYLVETGGRFLLVLAVTIGGTIFGAVALTL